jgi:hypothetical protein
MQNIDSKVSKYNNHNDNIIITISISISIFNSLNPSTVHERRVGDGVGTEAERKRRPAASLIVQGQSQSHGDGADYRWWSGLDWLVQ